MTMDHPAQTEASDFVSNLLEEYFGERPSSVNVVIEAPFILIHLQGFLMPSEKNLLKRNEIKRITETRDLLLNTLKPEIQDRLQHITRHEIEGVYADWNLEKETGLFIAVMASDGAKGENYWPAEIDRNALKNKIIETSKKTQKEPDHTELYWLNHNLIVIKRLGIMVDIEKELIKNGVIDELRLAKRPLEHRLMDSAELKPIVNRDIIELFVDWDFEKDKAYLVLILQE
ncbi:Na-translocating system protein MpsC family protein [Planococcus salinus]|nr:Na-translocating system protein MpsC family protein [Planococcus salinus]